MSRAVWVWVAALGLVGCFVEPVSLDDRHCPCAAGFVCNEVLDRCCTPTTPLTQDFRVEWATATTIRWRWTALRSDALGFGSYALVLAQSEEDLASRTGTAVVFDETINPELGGFNLSGTDSTADLVEATTTDGLLPDTTYLAQLRATDASGCPWVSPTVVGRTTSQPPFPIVLFEDALLGRPDPTELVLAPESDGTGNELVWDTTALAQCECGDPPMACSRCPANLKISDLDVSLADVPLGSVEGAERRAVLALDVRHDVSEPHHYARVWLMMSTDGICGGPCGVTYRFEPFTLRPGAPGGTTTQHIEVPLAALTYGADSSAAGCAMERTLRHDDLTRVCQVAFGASWPRGARVWLDNLVVRY